MRPAYWITVRYRIFENRIVLNEPKKSQTDSATFEGKMTLKVFVRAVVAPIHKADNYEKFSLAEKINESDSSRLSEKNVLENLFLSLNICFEIHSLNLNKLMLCNTVKLHVSLPPGITPRTPLCTQRSLKAAV